MMKARKVIKKGRPGIEVEGTDEEIADFITKRLQARGILPPDDENAEPE